MTILYKWLFFSYLICMSILSGLLLFEYSFLKNEIFKVLQIKYEYDNHVLVLKKMINEYSSTKEQSENLITTNYSIFKENNQINIENPFLTVNREPYYLRQAEIEYAKNYNLDNELKNIYEKEEIFECRIDRKYQKKILSKVSNKKPKKEINLNLLDKLTKKLQRDPIFIWPIERPNFWLSSIFGPRKKADGSYGFHTGIDMAALKGTSVRAVSDGKIIEAKYIKGYGKTILIKHNNKFNTRYAHLDKIFVNQNQNIKKGEIIGKVGSTGNIRKTKKSNDGSHLHFEVTVDGRCVNPFYFLV